MSTTLVRGVMVAGWLACALGSAHAQTETGKISGRITDDQGAVLPGATVTAVAVDTKVTRATATDDQGVYTFASVQPADYEIRVELAGFRTLVARTTVGVGATVSVDVRMQVGGLEEVVQVSAQEPLINTRTQEIATRVTQAQLRELPTITRSPYALVDLAGTASDQDPSAKGAGFSLNGLRGASTNVLLDGAANNDEFAGAVGQQVPLDAVQEFSVISNNFSAQFGRASGGIVNLLLKSGTNALHGSAYEFFRDDSLATNTFHNKARGLAASPFDRHQYGGSLGGPIKRDRMFFFGSAEYIRVRSSATDTSWVPTPELLARTSPDTQRFFAAYKLNTPINGPTLRRGEIAGANANGPFAALPAELPVFGQVTQNLPFDAGGGNPQNTLLAVAKVDVALKPGMSVYVRYALEHQDIFEGSNANSPWAGFNTGIKNVNNNILASFTNVWSPRFTTQSKVVFNRLNQQQPLGEAPVGPTLYMRASATSINGMNIALPGYLPFNPGVAIPFGGPQNFTQLYEDATWVLGAHDVRFGGSFTRFVDDRTFGAFQTSVLTLGTTFGNALDNLMLGQLQQFQGAVDPQGHYPGDIVTLPLPPPSFTRSNRYNEWAVYVTDAWQPRAGLTLNLGVRYEYFGVQHNKDPRLDSNFYLGTGANIFEQIRNGSVQIAPDSPVGGLWAPDRNNVAPRLGFAWDVTGDGRTSLRGGYSVGYERNFNNVTFNVIQNPPNSAVVSLVAGTDVPSIAISPDNAGPLAGTGTVRLPRTSLRFINPNIRTAYAHLWSLSFQRELIKGVTASVDYSASRGEKLYTLEDPNAPGSAQAYLGLGDLGGGGTGRLNRQYSNMNERNNNGFSRYHALVLGLDSRGVGATGLSFTGRYTFGRAQDNLSTTFSQSNNNVNLGLLDPFNPALDFGYADYDIRHRFVGGAIWELPFARTSGPLMRALAGGWQIASVVKLQTGAPFTVYDCTNGSTRCIRLLVQPGLERTPAKTLAPTSGAPNSFVYLDLGNQAAGIGSYAHPLTGTSDFGPFPANMDARNGFRQPGLWNVDAVFSKRFAIGAARGLQVRVELYNVFNHANLYTRLDATDVSASTQILSFRGDTGPNDNVTQGDGQRRVQLGVRFDF